MVVADWLVCGGGLLAGGVSGCGLLVGGVRCGFFLADRS